MMTKMNNVVLVPEIFPKVIFTREQLPSGLVPVESTIFYNRIVELTEGGGAR